MKAGSATGSVAVGYYRVSTKRQATEGISLTDQQAAVRAFCEQEGLALVDEYVERGASARSGDRPELQRLLADAKAKPRAFDTIVVYSRSRFYRDAPTMELTLRDLRKRGIELVSVSQPVSRDESGDLVRQIIAVVDEHASRETAKHVRSTMRANAAAGYWNGSRAPYGYRTVVCETIGKKQKKKLAIDEVEASTVRLIYRLAQVGDARSGPLGVKGIVNHLNGAGYRSPKGKMWHVGPLHALLTNPVYKGTYVYNRTDSRNGVDRPADEHVEVPCPAIVTPAVWDAVQALMRERNPKIAPPKTIAGPILLTGLVRCADCGGALTIRTGKSGRYRYYTCATSQARGKTACAGRSIRMEKLDAAVTQTLVDRLFEPSRLLGMIRSVEERGAAQRTEGSEELLRVEGDLTDAIGRLDRLYAAVERGLMDLDDPDLAKRVTAAQRDRAIATAAKERILARMGPRMDLTPEQVVRVAGLMRDRIQNGAVPFRKSYIRAVVETIVVDDKNAVITGRHDALRGCVNAGDTMPAAVPRSVQEWRTRQDSNL